MIEGHGDDAWKYGVDIRADFSSNVWYGGLDAGLRVHLQQTLNGLTHYPEAGAQSLQAAAAAAFGVAVEQVLVTNGATEGIYMIAQAFAGMTAGIVTPTFAEYEDACRMYGLDIDLEGAGIIFLCNPNNPTGAAMPLEVLRKWIGECPDTIFVIDESYIAFTRATSSLVPFLDQYPNVLVLRSLTKSCRIPGLRIGFVLGHPGLISRLYRYKMPWSVNRLAIEAGLYIFSHSDDFVVSVEELLTETERWRLALKEATGWEVYDTSTHYFLVEAPMAARDLKAWLLSQHGLLIRDAANFRGLSARHFRVACQSPIDNQLLTEALRQCSQTGC